MAALPKLEPDTLRQTLFRDRGVLAESISSTVQARLRTYGSLPREALHADVLRELEPLMRPRRGRAALTTRELAELAAFGEARARQGIPITDVLRGWHIGVEVVIDYAREVAQHLGIGDAEVLRFAQAALTQSDAVMVTTAQAFHKAELELTLAQEERAFVRDALFGTAPDDDLRRRAEAYGLDLDGEYIAVHARPAESALSRELERVLGFHPSGGCRRGMCAVVDGGIAGFSSRPPPEDVDAVVGYGPPRPLGRLAESYHLATRALVTARAYGMRGAHDISSLGLRAAVAGDSDVGELLRKRHLEPLAAGGSAGDLIATLRAYFACGLNVEQTATRLFVHQNTVRYRLARFEELSGANLRGTEALFEVWWAVESSTMTL